MSAAEYRAGAEIRLSGRVLAGRAMVYSLPATVAPGRREMFLPGAFGSKRLAVPLNLQHDPGLVLAEAGTFDLFDTPEALTMRAELPERSAAIRLVQRKALRGLSVEFKATRERQEGTLRVIERARLRAVGLVDAPAYPASLVEVRARLGQTIRATVPSGVQLDCDCLRTAEGRAEARWAEFQETAVRDMFDSVFAEAAGKDAVAALGAYGQPLASTAKGTMRGRMRGKDLEVEIDLPDDPNGRAVLAANESAGLVARPFVDTAQSQFEIVDETAKYSKAPLRAMILSATDRRRNWPDLSFIPTPEELLGDRAKVRRMLAWL